MLPPQVGQALQGSGAAAQGSTDQDRSTAEADMELIRTKRALTTLAAAAALGSGGGGTSGGKNKYRKRSRATPPGKCHSCNIRETPEWRRGPDGARTLCNACGLHYAKLVRKRDKALANGETPAMQRIDMEMLRASARAAEGEKLARA
ncbi:glucocorticoid receptor-like (DNA-binding domain), partial [Rhizopogon salebrosus TDB-379]